MKLSDIRKVLDRAEQLAKAKGLNDPEIHFYCTKLSSYGVLELIPAEDMQHDFIPNLNEFQFGLKII